MNDGYRTVEVSISKLLLRALEHWKGIFVVSLLFALFISFAGGFLSYRSAVKDKSLMDSMEGKTDEELLEMIENDKERSNIISLAKKYETIQYSKEYAGKSLIYNLEDIKPGMLQSINLQWKINAATAMPDSYYRKLLCSTESVDVLKRAIGTDVDDQHIHDIIRFDEESYPGTNDVSAFSASILLPQDNDANRVISAVDEWFRSKSDAELIVSDIELLGYSQYPEDIKKFQSDYEKNVTDYDTGAAKIAGLNQKILFRITG